MQKHLFYSLIILALLSLTACAHVKKSSTKQTQPVIKHPKIVTKTDPIKQRLDKMTLDQKLGQLYFIHSSGNSAQIKQLIQKYQIGGITLFGPDFTNENRQSFLAKIKQYQALSHIKLFIATDQEGGTVSRLNANPLISSRQYLSPQKIYQQAGLAGITQENQTVSQILKANGINFNFAPVADVSSNKSSFIYQRTLGQSYQETARYIKVAVKSYQDHGVAATLKHFPGYGDAGDTHTGFSQINKSLASYENQDLLPFKAGIAAKVSAIMVSHILIKALDPTNPASLSPAVHKLLRQKLHYQGLIITDDLEMGAITQFASQHQINPDLLALKAGNDLLLGADPATSIPKIKQAIKEKQISLKQIDQSVYRILKVKEKLGLL